MESVSTKPYQYRIVECLGEGLNSCVYRAFKESKELNVRFEVALKILKSKNLEALWRNEFERLARVKSLHCVVLHGWEIINGSPALVLEYVRGVNLSELLKFVELSGQDIDCVYAQAYRGLTELAQAGLFHGDLNLNNIMVDDSGTVKLVDFGIRNGRKGYFVTPKFAAPSVLMGHEPSLETDLFSLEAICSAIEARNTDSDTGELAQQAIQNLAKKVRIAMQKRESARVRTNAYRFTRQMCSTQSAWIQRITVCVFCLFLSMLSRGDSNLSRGNASRVAAPARLIVRTVKWLKVTVNGRYAGYAPITIAVSPARPIQLHWVDASGEGDRALALSPGQTEILTDEFFGPNSK